MGHLEGRVAIVTGAARGIGREHALLLAEEGASVVVNDLAGGDKVASEIRERGGRAIGQDGDVAEWEFAHRLVDAAVEAFGGLDVLVNNAGIGGGDLVSEMSEEDWDEQIRVNLKGVFCPTRAAVAFWKGESEAGRPVRASVVSTSSGAGLLGNPGQSHYGAAKAGVAAFTVIAAMELESLGVRLNAIAPAARTAMSGEGGSGVVAEFMRAPDNASEFDAWHPANVSPLVAYLATGDCPLTGEIFHIRGSVVGHFHGWVIGRAIESERRWTVGELAERLPDLVAQAPDRADAGGVAYAALRDALQKSRLATTGKS